jgi:hypothetical protein
MTPDQVFTIANGAAPIVWLLLALFPRRRLVVDSIVGTAVPAALAVAYTAIVAAVWRDAHGSFASLAGVAALFTQPWLLLAGWLHYLAFDLLVGRWEVLDAQRHRVPHWMVVPCLAATLMFGPAGWLLYRGVRLCYGAKRESAAPGLPGAGAVADRHRAL